MRWRPSVHAAALAFAVALDMGAVHAADVPAVPGAGCAEATAAQAQGFDAARLCKVLADFAASTVNLHALVVERHGVVVAQAYRRGTDASIYTLFARSTAFDANTLHDVRSISKSVTSLLWGIADGAGLMPPLDTKVLDLLPELAELKTQGREAITLAHLFDMSSGLDWNEPNAYNARNDELGLYWRGSQARYLFNRPMAAPAGTRWNYNGGGTAVLAQLLEARVGMPLAAYARQVLFDPLGITAWEWKNDVRGRALAFAGLRLRPLDMARIGRLVLNHGAWQGRQVVPAAWVTESTRPRIDTGDGLRYGGQWWGGRVQALGTAHPWSAGFGNGGQRLYVVPGLDLVVAVTAGDYNTGPIGPLVHAVFKDVVAAVREPAAGE